MKTLKKSNRKFKTFYYKKLGRIRIHIHSDGKPWFCFSDICDILNIEKPQKILDCVDIPFRINLNVYEELKVERDCTYITYNVLRTFISEDGLYQLLRRSRHPEAKLFMDWICCSVLPTIRNARKCKKKSTKSNYDKNLTIGKLLVKYENEIDSLRRENKKLKEKLSIYETQKIEKEELYKSFVDYEDMNNYYDD